MTDAKLDLKDLPLSLQPRTSYPAAELEKIEDNLAIFINNIILYCKLNESQLIDQDNARTMLETLKAQLNQLWFEEKLKNFSEEFQLEYVEETEAFQKKLFELEQIIRGVVEQKNNASSESKYVGYENEANKYVQHLENFLTSTDIKKTIQNFDIYAYSKLIEDSGQSQQIDIPRTHFFKELINTKINYGPNVFHFVRPENHQYYITEASRTYHDIAPFKLKTISLSIADGPVISRPNFFEPDIDVSKAILSICIAGTKKLGFYAMADLCQLQTVGKEYYHQRQLANDWTFSNFTKSVTTPSGKIFAVNCRSTKQKADPYLYQITQTKASNRGPMPAAKRHSAVLFLNGCIYLIGGQGEGEKCSRKSYRYSLRDKKWTQLTECNVALRKATVCGVNNRYILKLGGLNQFDYINKVIEMYDSVTDRWSMVRASPRNIMEEIEILEDAQAVQISEDQVYIFGGKNANRFNTDTGFVLLISQIREKKRGAAKVSGEFWNVSAGKRNLLTFFGQMSTTSVVIQHNCIYGLRSAVTSALSI